MRAQAMPKAAEFPGFGPLLGETGRAWRYRLDQRLKPLGLSQAKWITLRKLSWAEDGMSQKELAERLGVENPTLARLLDRMAADGWIERRGSDTDRRVKTVHLRRKSFTLLQQINAVAMRLSAELLEGVPPDELRACMKVLQCIKDKALGLDAPGEVNRLSSVGGSAAIARANVGKRIAKKHE
jgi:MarR family transcriptional regulator for hemolysin